MTLRPIVFAGCALLATACHHNAPASSVNGPHTPGAMTGTSGDIGAGVDQPTSAAGGVQPLGSSHADTSGAPGTTLAPGGSATTAPAGSDTSPGAPATP